MTVKFGFTTAQSMASLKGFSDMSSTVHYFIGGKYYLKLYGNGINVFVQIIFNGTDPGADVVLFFKHVRTS